MSRVLIFVCATPLAFACAPVAVAQEGANLDQFERSARLWTEAKAKCGGNYSYQVRFSSFTGAGHSTEIVVRGNKVAQRKFQVWGPPVPIAPGQAAPPAEPKWVETGDQVGSHKEGAPPKTLDELYTEASNVIRAKLEPHQKLYVRYDKQGLLEYCFTIDTRIADDAPRHGVMISNLALGQAATAGAAADKDGWEVLLDGKSLDAWDYDPKTLVWAINEQGELYPAKGGRDLFTKQRYCDFVLEVDFKLAGKAKSNSGVFIRVHDAGNPVNTGMEIQILDNADYGVKWDAMNANGALYGLVHPAVDANKPLGEWNTFRVTVDKSMVTIELNGKEIVKADLDRWATVKRNPDGKGNKFPYAIAALPQEGFVALQNYGGKSLWFRNVRIKKLSDRKPQFTGKEPMADVLRKIGG